MLNIDTIINHRNVRRAGRVYIKPEDRVVVGEMDSKVLGSNPDVHRLEQH